MASIELCPRCGAEVRVHLHTTTAGVAIISGRCFNCGRLVAFRFSPAEVTLVEQTPGQIIGWTIASFDEDRGWRRRTYSIDERALMGEHIRSMRINGEYFTVEEVRA